MASNALVLHSSVLFISQYDRFVSQMRKSKLIKIEAQFFQEGLRVLEFNVECFEMR